MGVLLAAACPIGIAVAEKFNATVTKAVVSVVLIVAAGVLFGNTIPKMLPTDNVTQPD